MSLWLGFSALVLLALAFVLVPAMRSGRNEPAARERDIAQWKIQLREQDLALQAQTLDATDATLARQQIESHVLATLDSIEPSATEPARARALAAALLVLLPLLTLGLYLHLGAPSVIDAQQLVQARVQHDVDRMITALETKLKNSPDDAQAWFVLGRSYVAMQRLADAQKALARASQLSPREARMLSHYAEILALNADGNLRGQPQALIDQALEIDANDDKALELAGLAAYQREDWAQAAHFWRRLTKRQIDGSDERQELERLIAQVEAQAANRSGMAPPARTTTSAPRPSPH